jgi:hypothetical protein
MGALTGPCGLAARTATTCDQPFDIATGWPV